MSDTRIPKYPYYSLHDALVKVFPQRLRELRERIGISQERLASELEISRSAIVYYEGGKRIPDIYFLLAIHDLTGVNVNYLLGIEDSIRPIKNARFKTNDLNTEQLENLCYFLDSLTFQSLLNYREAAGLFAWLDNVALIRTLGVDNDVKEIVEYKAASRLGKIISDAFIELRSNNHNVYPSRDSEVIAQITHDYYLTEYNKARLEIEKLIPGDILERDRRNKEEAISFVKKKLQDDESDPIAKFRKAMLDIDSADYH
jgi:transcriptional regulator with XRE-family HTH domain